MMPSIRDLIANDAHAITFQTMAQYRTALLLAIDESAQQANRSSNHLARICHNLTLAMQAAWIEWEHGAGADAAMQWIQNTLIGPGLIPDEDEPHSTQAQAYFDANIDPTPDVDRLNKLADENPDDAAIDRFAIELKKKLAKARDKGRGGWQTCPPTDLSRMLREHVEKGDPRDVANFCAFLWALEQPIAPLTDCFELSLVPPNGAATSHAKRTDDARDACAAAVQKAVEDAQFVFKDSCNHTMQAIDYMRASIDADLRASKEQA